MTNVLESMPLTCTQAIRQFARSIEGILLSTLESFPLSIITTKVSAARRFSHSLKRRTSLNHLAQAVRTVLSSEDQMKQMYQDWCQIDFDSIKEQSQWIIKTQTMNLTDFVENSFKTYLKQDAELEMWAEWIENVMDQFIPQVLCAIISFRMARFLRMNALNRLSLNGHFTVLSSCVILHLEVPPHLAPFTYCDCFLMSI